MAKKMNKKELSEAIREGIYQGFWKPIIITIGLFIGIMIIFGIIGHFTDPCRDGGCSMAEPSCFPLDNVHCEIIVGEIGSEDYNEEWVEFSVCGWQEAETKLKHFKEFTQDDLDWINNNTGRYKEIKKALCE